jgi:HlyD family secretion protein
MNKDRRFKIGSQWLALSAALTITTAGGWLLYGWLNRPSATVEVHVIAVEKGTVEDLLNESGTVELGEQQTLKSPVDGGIVEQILVKAGESAQANQTLLVLRDPERQTALAQQQLEIQKQALQVARRRQESLEAAQNLADAQRQLQTLAIEAALIEQQELQLSRNREKVVEINRRLQNLRQELATLVELVELGGISGREVRQKQDQVLTLESESLDAQLAVTTAELELDKLRLQRQSKESQFSGDILSTRLQLRDAQLATGQDNRELLRLQLERQKIVEQSQKNLVKSTLAGKVLNIPVKVGDVVELGDPLLTLGQPTTELVKVELSPLDAARLRTGKQARIRAIGANPKRFRGLVTEIAELAAAPGTGLEPSKGEKKANNTQATVTVTVKLNRPSQVLVPGSKVDVEILVEQRQDVVILERDAVQNSGKEAFVWVQDANGKAQQRPVVLGLEGLTRVEIKSGLRPGDKIILPLAGLSLQPGTPVRPVDK